MEKTIGTLVQASMKQTNTPCNNLPSVCSNESKTFLARFPTRGDVERAYNPQHWEYALTNPTKAYMASCPTLAKYDAIYGKGASSDWIYIQVLALYGSSSSRDKALVDGIGLFSATFAQEARTYKLSELMLFFARYKAGRYDNSYSSFDTKRIGNAFFKEFLPQRNAEMDAAIRYAEQEESMKRRELPEGYIIPQGYNPYTWYLERKRRGELTPIQK